MILSSITRLPPSQVLQISYQDQPKEILMFGGDRKTEEQGGATQENGRFKETKGRKGALQ